MLSQIKGVKNFGFSRFQKFITQKTPGPTDFKFGMQLPSMQVYTCGGQGVQDDVIMTMGIRDIFAVNHRMK